MEYCKHGNLRTKATELFHRSIPIHQREVHAIAILLQLAQVSLSDHSMQIICSFFFKKKQTNQIKSVDPTFLSLVTIPGHSLHALQRHRTPRPEAGQRDALTSSSPAQII